MQLHQIVLRELVDRPVEIRMRWAAARRCWVDFLRSHTKPIFRCASWRLELQAALSFGGTSTGTKRDKRARPTLTHQCEFGREFGSEYPRLDVIAKVVQCRGCDASPIDPGTEEGRLTLQSYVWPDQVERFRQLAAASDVAQRVPAKVDQGNAPDWVEAALADGVPGVVTAGLSPDCLAVFVGAGSCAFRARDGRGSRGRYS